MGGACDGLIAPPGVTRRRHYHAIGRILVHLEVCSDTQFPTAMAESVPSLHLKEGIKTDAAHLRGSLTKCAAKPDIVLYTTDGDVETELPVHAKLLSKHSRVLSEMITACNELRIHMVGDKLSELTAMLTIMYREWLYDQRPAVGCPCGIA